MYTTSITNGYLRTCVQTQVHNTFTTIMHRTPPLTHLQLSGSNIGPTSDSRAAALRNVQNLRNITRIFLESIYKAVDTLPKEVAELAAVIKFEVGPTHRGTHPHTCTPTTHSTTHIWAAHFQAHHINRTCESTTLPLHVHMLTTPIGGEARL